MREAGLVTKRIQGARGYAQLRKQHVDRRFPGLLDSTLNADAAAYGLTPHPAVIIRPNGHRVPAPPGPELATSPKEP